MFVHTWTSSDDISNAWASFKISLQCALRYDDLTRGHLYIDWRSPGEIRAPLTDAWCIEILKVEVFKNEKSFHPFSCVTAAILTLPEERNIALSVQKTSTTDSSCTRRLQKRRGTLEVEEFGIHVQSEVSELRSSWWWKDLRVRNWESQSLFAIISQRGTQSGHSWRFVTLAVIHIGKPNDDFGIKLRK